MSNDVKRYDIDGFGNGMVERPDGAFYHMDDYTALEAECARLRLKVMVWNDGKPYAALKAQRDALAAELQALKAPCSEVPEVVGLEVRATEEHRRTDGSIEYHDLCRISDAKQIVAALRGRQEAVECKNCVAVQEHEQNPDTECDECGWKGWRNGKPLAPAAQDVSGLAAFAIDLIDGALQGGNFDGGEIQVLGVKHGLLHVKQRTESCGEHCACAEFGFPSECYRLVKSIARQAQQQAG